MNNLKKMKKVELKELFIKKIVEIETLLAWYDEHNIRYFVEALIFDSNYLGNRSYKNPKDVGHKFMDKAIYISEITRLQKLIDQLEEVRGEFEKGNLNHLIDNEIEVFGNSNQNQLENNIISKQDKGNSIQKDNEKSNQIQNRRGGKREGAGRKGFGITKKVSLTLSEETWGMIEGLCEKGNLKQSKVLRDIIEGNMKG